MENDGNEDDRAFPRTYSRLIGLCIRSQTAIRSIAHTQLLLWQLYYKVTTKNLMPKTFLRFEDNS